MALYKRLVHPPEYAAVGKLPLSETKITLHHASASTIFARVRDTWIAVRSTPAVEASTPEELLIGGRNA